MFHPSIWFAILSFLWYSIWVLQFLKKVIITAMLTAMSSKFREFQVILNYYRIAKFRGISAIIFYYFTRIEKYDHQQGRTFHIYLYKSWKKVVMMMCCTVLYCAVLYVHRLPKSLSTAALTFPLVRTSACTFAASLANPISCSWLSCEAYVVSGSATAGGVYGTAGWPQLGIWAGVWPAGKKVETVEMKRINRIKEERVDDGNWCDIRRCKM